MGKRKMYTSIFNHIQNRISLSTIEFDYFTSLLHFKKLKKKEYLLKAGEVCKYETFVIRGCLRSYFADKEGNESIIEFGTENNWISDLNSFLKAIPSKLNIDALEETEIAQINRASLDKLYLLFPNFERYFRIISEDTSIIQQERLIDNLTKSAKERYLKFLKENSALDQRLPQYHIASFLGFTPQFLSQIRTQFSRESIREIFIDMQL